MAVTTRTQPSAMTEEEERAKVTSETKDKILAGKKVSPEEEDLKIYTQKQADALMHAKDSEWGRKYKEVETERNTFQDQLGAKDKDLAANAEDIKNLEAKLEDLTKDDPERFNAVKELRIAREERRQLKLDREALEADKQTHAETVKFANDTLLEIRVFEIAGEYEAGDAVRLKSLCDIFNASSEEQIRKVAETIWSKRDTAPEENATKVAPKPYSGKSDGGSPYFTRAQIADRDFWNAHKAEILKAQKEGRIRD